MPGSHTRPFTYDARLASAGSHVPDAYSATQISTVSTQAEACSQMGAQGCSMVYVLLLTLFSERLGESWSDSLLQ